MGHSQAAVIGIFLRGRDGRDLRVGSLIREAEGGNSFLVDDGYIGLGPNRPIVSLAWRGQDEVQSIARLRKPDDKSMRGGFLPAFFQNMLPEGKLRELVEKEFGAGRGDNFDIIAKLGGDLPGAIVAKLEAGTPPPARSEFGPHHERPLWFSLTGMQLKFSMSGGNKRLSVPVETKGGSVILKTPSEQHPNLPEFELTAMRLIAAIGVRTAEAWLVDPGDVEGIPEQYIAGGRSLAVARFDRTADGGRIHMEDFAQIVGAIDDRKYTMINEETVFNIVRRFADDSRGELLEAVRRSVANILVGNGDAHAKNWSFIYADGIRAALTPAYDVVPTVLYGDERLGLQFGNTHNPSNITLRRYERAAGLAKVDPKVLVREVKRTVENALDVWPKMMKDLPIAEKHARRLQARWGKMALVRECTGAATPSVLAQQDDEPPFTPTP